MVGVAVFVAVDVLVGVNEGVGVAVLTAFDAVPLLLTALGSDGLSARPLSTTAKLSTAPGVSAYAFCPTRTVNTKAAVLPGPGDAARLPTGQVIVLPAMRPVVLQTPESVPLIKVVPCGTVSVTSVGLEARSPMFVTVRV